MDLNDGSQLFPHEEIFSLIGGLPTFKRLVDIFYLKVEKDEIIRHLFPENLDPGKHLQYLFLSQKFGGPQEYKNLRGHAQLRKRHLKFKIGMKERNRWVELMFASLDEIGINQDHPARFTLNEYFERVGTKMVNSRAGFKNLMG